MTASPTVAWWRGRREDLLAALGERDCAYVYDAATAASRARNLLAMRSVARVLYAIKANPHPVLLQAIAAAGLGFECVSRAEIEHVRQAVPGIARGRLLFTPNFAPRDEYRWALESGIRVTVDNLEILRSWTAMFRGREILLRLDTGHGLGHHEKVRTAGLHSKFGVPPEEFGDLTQAAAAAEAKVIGLHAHAGSGHFQIAGWIDAAQVLATQSKGFPNARILNLGGGLGVPDRPDQPPFDLAAFDAALAGFRTQHPHCELWIEPGRYVVAEAGVLLARVTQTKGKGTKRYVGVATGMNSLIRPALYGAWHEIVNLTRLEEPANHTYTVVGPICESGDELGTNRLLPACEENDVLLIANAGAYGHVMSSNYNLRPPAAELVLPA
jgi:diaminopimelate decarboxylase/aspartate kinase